MRFEGKHNYLKDLASRHQRLVCYHFSTDKSSIFKEPLFGTGLYTYIFM